ncbi:phosphonate C-P lyase system protein PhnG [Limnohabitans sp.]|uniref:phosphonate C-P lyase system protein PhnG n=1 Tax=Limnohabitans sp. TaxID=1907725 RepID=UPI002FDE2A16
MFQTFDTNSPHARQSWMALLARAPQPLLDAALAEHTQTQPQWLRRPETGLMMVQGRVGNTGERFNLGEVTVTRCALRLDTATADAPVGVAYVLGRNHRQAQLAAVADALLQDPKQHPVLEASLLTPLRQHLQTRQASRHARAQTTKVDFLTVAREAGSLDAGDEA